jgi:hypothetical protein
MTRVYKTAKGKPLDMDKIKLSNELVTSVGNMKINARGDKLGAGGKISAGRNQVMDRVYAVEASQGYSPNSPEQTVERQSVMQANKAKELHDLTNNLIKNESIENVPTVSDQPATRGSLASSVAKTAVVKQELMPDPKKSNGPTRI